MHTLISFILLALSLPLVVNSKSIYIDSTCTSKTEWNDYWKEAQGHTKRAVERIDSGSDTDFEAVFKRIYQTEKGSEDGKYARSIHKEIAGLNQVDDLKASDIRLFCDNDKRWGKQRSTGGWYDEKNDMITSIEPSCRKKGVMGRSYERTPQAPTDENSPRAGHNPNRIVVSLCDELFNEGAEGEEGEEGPPLRITDEVKNENLRDSPISYFSFMVSHTLIHELAHAVSAKNGRFTVQDLPNLLTAYGWENIITKQASVAVKNADNHAYLGIWAGLADLGYTLPRLNEDGLTEEEKEDREADAVDGYIDKYSDITKRMLMKLVGMSFSA